MNSTQFFLKYNNQPLDVDHAYGDQCVDVIKAYFAEVLDLAPVKGDAIDYWNKPPQGFIKIPKTWFNQPQPGDIIVLNIGVSGHIAICNWSRMFDWGGFEQNFPLGSVCHYQDHPNYKGVLGWLRPIQPVQTAGPFIMKYTCFNADPVLMEQARQLILRLSGGKMDASFNFFTIPDINSPGLESQDNEATILLKYPVSTPFVFMTYNDPDRYTDMMTSEVPGTKTIVTAANPGGIALNVCFEMVHAISKYMQDQGIQVDVLDEYTPTEEFLQEKLNKIIPNLTKIK